MCEVSDSIRAAREERGVSLSSLASILNKRGADVSRKQISSIENGETVKINMHSLNELFKVLRVNPAKVFNTRPQEK